MKILKYVGLDTSRNKSQYRKVTEAIERDDFQSAEVKKLTNLSHGKFYRAKLDYTNRLLFSVVRNGDAVYALMLEVIENHAYEKSRFLRGALVDEDKIPLIAAAEAAQEAAPLRYVHPQRREVHLLDKVISFDDAQEAIYRLPPPLIVVGSAGSGKTALTLEKLKHAEGEVLYVTHSAYLAQSARDLYYSHGFEREGQDATFLSYREFLETLRVPAGQEASWRHFAGWFERMRQQFKGVDAPTKPSRKSAASSPPTRTACSAGRLTGNWACANPFSRRSKGTGSTICLKNTGPSWPRPSYTTSTWLPMLGGK